jgi:L-alanine-DL-glutamate epimerase-like enolase superfamily enzyme
MVAVVAIYGIAWLADTYFSNYLDEIKMMMSDIVTHYPWAIALVFFIVSVLINSQGAVVVTMLPLAVDANQGWKDREKALEEIFWLKEQGIVMVEQPMPKERIDDNAWLTERSPLPIFADEAIQRLKDIPSIKGAYTGINIKLMKCTGMREAWKMANYAHAEGMRVMVGCMTETSCAVTAAAQLSPIVDFADLDGNLLISNDRFRGMEVVNGKITLPDRPGLGLIKL